MKKAREKTEVGGSGEQSTEQQIEGKELRKAMIDFDLSTVAIGAALGMHPSNVTNALNGRPYTGKTLKRIAAYIADVRKGKRLPNRMLAKPLVTR